MKVIITPEAERDLEAIGDYIARDNPVRAESFVGELVGRCAGLADFPERFPLFERFAKAGVRRCMHGRYLIFYRIDPGIVRVLHILHGASDYAVMFEGLDFGA